MSTNEEKAIRTICGFCHTNCGLIAYVKDGVITRIKADPDHPVNGGADCPKGRAGKEIVYSPDRLQYPLRKAKSGFKRISWDEALDTISDKLLKIRHQYGGKTIIRGVGAPVTEENRDGFSQLVAMLGSNDYIGVGHICHQPLNTIQSTFALPASGFHLSTGVRHLAFGFLQSFRNIFGR